MPADLTPAEFRRHPVTQLLSAAAMGYVPEDEELDELRLPDELREIVSAAATQASEAHKAGQMGQARSIAREAAEQVVAELPRELLDPDYLKEPEPEVTDPAELAARVSRNPF